MRIAVLGCFLLFIGCHAAPYKYEEEKTAEERWKDNDKWERPVSKTLLPASLVAAYLGTVAVHEAGHASLMGIYGDDSIKIDIFPGKDKDGSFHLGTTTAHYYYNNRPNSTAQAEIDVSGPAFTFGSQIFTREILKSGYVPDILQPSLQWYGVFNKGSYYGELILGLARVKNADFGKQPLWMTGLFTGVGLIYDIYDFFICDSPERYLKVLIGEAFYEPKETSIFRFWVGAVDHGGLANVSVVW